MNWIKSTAIGGLIALSACSSTPSNWPGPKIRDKPLVPDNGIENIVEDPVKQEYEIVKVNISYNLSSIPNAETFHDYCSVRGIKDPEEKLRFAIELGGKDGLDKYELNNDMKAYIKKEGKYKNREGDVIDKLVFENPTITDKHILDWEADVEVPKGKSDEFINQYIAGKEGADLYELIKTLEK